MSDSESSSSSSSSKPQNITKSFPVSTKTYSQAPKQTQNVQQESSTSDDAEFQKNMKQSNTVFNEVKRCGFSNAVVQTGNGRCLQSGIVFTRQYTVPTQDKQTQKNENDEIGTQIHEEQIQVNENKTQSKSNQNESTNLKETVQINTTKRSSLQNAIIQTGTDCVQNKDVMIRLVTAPTVDKNVQIGENLHEAQKQLISTVKNETKTNQKETNVEQFETKTKGKDENTVLEESESVKEESDINIQISESDDKAIEKQNQEDEKKKLEADKLKQQEQVEQYQSPKSQSNHTGQTQMNEQLIKKQPAQTEPNQSQKSAWFYIDSKNIRQGPFTSAQMNMWNMKQKLPLGLKIQQGLGEYFTLKQEHLKMSSFFQDHDEINIYQIINNSRQYECMLAHAETQTGLNDLEISVSQTRQYFSKLVIPPSFEKCINTELSLRRGNQDELFVENTFNTFKDVQAVEAHDTPVYRKPIIKKGQPHKQDSIFAPEANLKQNNINPDLDPEQKQINNRPIKNKLDFDYDYNSIDYNHFNQTNQEGNAQQQENQNYYQPEQNQYIPNNSSDDTNSQNNYPLRNMNQINIEQNAEQQTQIRTNSSEYAQQDTAYSNLIALNLSEQFKILVKIAIEDYFLKSDNLRFNSFQEMIIHYRRCIVEDATKIHINLKQIAAKCQITEKQCNSMFQTLLSNVLIEWPKDIVAQVVQRIPQINYQLSQDQPELSVAQKESQIRLILDEEFQLKHQVQYDYKQITNKINYQLKKLRQ
ncbi:GYF_domain [Hexamita inflata]|uniref:GYF domain n=1 Tax=Hexamita inflata TaxID=28002 RepID=A0AA86QRH7_9EUKA|nr:GYF domain [Hexamita inflata]